MALILAIEPDVAQAVILRQVISELVPADLCLVDSKAAALAALEKNVPTLILISAMLPAHEEQELVAYLRTTTELAHQQTLMIPRLASPTDLAASGKRSFFKRGAGEPVGCDPRIFANEVCALPDACARGQGCGSACSGQTDRRRPGTREGDAEAARHGERPEESRRAAPGRPAASRPRPRAAGGGDQAATRHRQHRAVARSTVARRATAGRTRPCTAGWGEARATGHDEPDPLRVASALRRAHGHRTQCRTARRGTASKPRGGHTLANAPAPPYRASRARLARA